MIAGTAGYEAHASELIPRYEGVAFEHKHRHVLHLIPCTPCEVLDIGAGTGADAAFLAAAGHRVLAVEPTAALRRYGIGTHRSARIEWLDDSLPALAAIRARDRTFDLVMMTAVWMHLERAERAAAMPGVAALVRGGGVLIMSLRHGPVPAGRRMVEVTAQETIALAQAHALQPLVNVRAASTQPENRRAGVEWSHLGFRRAAETDPARLRPLRHPSASTA